MHRSHTHETPVEVGPSSIAPVAWTDTYDPPVIPLEPPLPRWVWISSSIAALFVLISALAAGSGEAIPEPAAPVESPVARVEDSEHETELVPLAIEGDGASLERLLMMPADARSVTEVLALTEGQRVRELRSARALIDAGVDGISQADRRQLLALARRADTGPEVLGALAASGASRATDLIFSVRQSAAKGSVLSIVAAQLLLSPSTRAASSPALSVAVELERIRDCEGAALLVHRAISDADRRALGGLRRLARRTGCGPDGRGDCFACLRGSRELAEAVRSASRRTPPGL
ncbi:MAG: hypothetical protein IPI67_24800 [Myxococcales bacterium]|nr:hypothetical protein [Myxococcales bacterium]